MPIIRSPIGSLKRGVNVLLPPTDFGWKPSFAVLKNGATTINYSDHVSGNEYYVDPATGSDVNDGAIATPLATIKAAMEKVDGTGTKIYAKPGRYFDDWPDNHRPPYQQDFSFAPWPGESGRIKWVSGYDPTAVTWVDEGSGAWSATLANVHYVVDLAVEDANGIPTPLTKRASLADVQTLGGWHESAGTVYVKTDGLEPDDDICVLATFDAKGYVDALNHGDLYLNKIDLIGAGFFVRANVNSPKIGNTFIADDCKVAFTDGVQDAWYFGSLDANYPAVAYLRNCVAAYSADGFNYAANLASCRAVEESCTAYECGYLGSLDAPEQCSTGHVGSEVIRVSGQYYHSYGEVIAESSADSWNLFCDLGPTLSTGPSRDVDGFDDIGTSQIWSYRCTITGGNKSYLGTVYADQNTADGSGTPTAYKQEQIL